MTAYVVRNETSGAQGAARWLGKTSGRPTAARLRPTDS